MLVLLKNGIFCSTMLMKIFQLPSSVPNHRAIIKPT